MEIGNFLQKSDFARCNKTNLLVNAAWSRESSPCGRSFSDAKTVGLRGSFAAHTFSDPAVMSALYLISSLEGLPLHYETPVYRPIRGHASKSGAITLFAEPIAINCDQLPWMGKKGKATPSSGRAVTETFD